MNEPLQRTAVKRGPLLFVPVFVGATQRWNSWMTFAKFQAEKIKELETEDSCFYVGSFCQALFVLRLVQDYIPKPEVRRPSLRRRPASSPACPGRGVKVAWRRRETLTPRRGMLRQPGRSEGDHTQRPFWLAGSDKAMGLKDPSSFYPCRPLVRSPHAACAGVTLGNLIMKRPNSENGALGKPSS